MANYFAKPRTWNRGELAKGKIVGIADNEIIVDLGAKAEGVVSKRDLSPEQLENLRIGDDFEAFVVSPEGDSGQIILSPFKQLPSFGRKNQEQNKKWQKFINAMQRKSKLNGRVMEVNKGGLVVEVDSIRGFLPSSHIGLSNMAGSKDAGGLAGLVGQELSLNVIEVDPGGNRLIFSARGQVSKEAKAKLDNFKEGQKLSGKVVAIVPFGLLVDLGGVEGVIYSQEISWEAVEDPAAEFEVGQDVEGMVTGKDETLAKVILSIRQLSADPFEKLAEDFLADDVVRGTVNSISSAGIEITLSGGVAGFIPAVKVDQGTKYQAGEEVSVLVDSIDKNKRRINLAPFLTSTVGLIYK